MFYKMERGRERDPESGYNLCYGYIRREIIYLVFIKLHKLSYEVLFGKRISIGSYSVEHDSF